MARTTNVPHLFAMLAWVLAREGASVAEIAEHFELPEKAVLDAVDTLGSAYFGDGGFDTQFEVDWDEFYENKNVIIRDIHGVSSRIGLSNDETIAFVVGLNFLASILPDDMKDSAASAALKLLGAKDLDIDLSRFVIIDPEGDAELREQVLDAVRDGNSIRFEYVNGQGERSSRDLKPTVLNQSDGHWIVEGYDLGAEGPRAFRLDRMSELSVGAPVDLEELPVEAKKRAKTVEVLINPRAKWATEGRAQVNTHAGITRARYAVLQPRWMQNQLLLLGGAIEDCSDPESLKQAKVRAQQAKQNRERVRELWHA